MSDVLVATKQQMLILACQIPHRTHRALATPMLTRRDDLSFREQAFAFSTKISEQDCPHPSFGQGLRSSTER